MIIDEVKKTLIGIGLFCLAALIGWLILFVGLSLNLGLPTATLTNADLNIMIFELIGDYH